MYTVRLTARDAGGHTSTRDVPIVQRIRLGSSNVDNTTELTAYEQRYGRLDMRRSYNQPADGIPATWAASAAGMDANRRHSVYSFKPNIPNFAAGTLDNPFRTFRNSIPVDGWIKYVIPWHEPEGEIKSGLFTPAQYKAAAARCDALCKETGRKDLVAMVCFAGTQCFDGQTMNPPSGATWPPFNADSLCPPGMAACFDIYNKYPEAGSVWRELHERTTLQITWAQAGGRRWGISETGCYEHPDGPQRKVAWTTNAVNWVESEGGEFITYWDNAFSTDPDPNKRRIHSSTQHIALWTDLSAARR